MIGDWMTTDGSQVFPRKIDLLPCSVRASQNLTRLLLLPLLCEGIPVASDRSVVSGVQYPLAESDGRECGGAGSRQWLAPTLAHTQMDTHSRPVCTNEGGR